MFTDKTCHQECNNTYCNWDAEYCLDSATTPTTSTISTTPTPTRFTRPPTKVGETRPPTSSSSGPGAKGPGR